MRKIIIAGMIGNGLEWYDFALYAYTALIISQQFFPAGNDAAHLLATWGIFAVSFLARPFGGVFFGVIGDRFGRRAALVLSIFMMAIPTGCIGLLPTYAQIGITAPLLLIVIRILQGLSLGGAFSGSMAFLVEHAPVNRRALIGSASIVSLGIGFLLGSLMAVIVKAPLTEIQYESWGWRIPFLLGTLIGFIGFYIRHHCEESPLYEAAKQDGTLSATPVRDVIRYEWKHMLQAIGIYLTVTMPFYLMSAYFLTYTEHSLGRKPEEALILGSVNMLIMIVLAPVSAWVSDQIGRRAVHAVGAALFLFASIPIFTLMQQPSFASIAAAQMLFALIVAIYVGPIPALLVEIFPTRVRYTGMALSYNITAALFGGTAPMVCQWLLNTTHDSYSIAYYVMISALISLVALFFYKERHTQALT